jgi:hypothetical protein
MWRYQFVVVMVGTGWFAFGGRSTFHVVGLMAVMAGAVVMSLWWEMVHFAH